MANPQRVDLNTAAPTGDRVHGSNAADQAAMDAVPVRPAPQPTPGPLPGEAGDLLRPTERPDEPITAGLDVGEGNGSDALLFGQQNIASRQRYHHLMQAQRLAALTNDPVLKRLANG